jgi:hypothetical protein
MSLQSRMTPLPVTLPRQTISRSSRSMGIYLLAGRGTGKSRLLGRQIALEDFLAGIPQCVIDPVGATIDNFLDTVLWFLQRLPASQHPYVLQRIRYVDMSGKGGVIVPFPLYYQLGSERSLLEIAERYLQVIIKSNPDLFHAQVFGWPPLHRLGVYCGMALAALGYQITAAERLLAQPQAFLPRLTHAQSQYPELAEVIAYFRDEYLPMREQHRRQVTTPFRDKMFTFPLDPTLQAMFGAANPGISWPAVVKNRETVLLDFRDEQDEEMRRFKLLWAFDYLFSWIKTRGRSEREPFGVIVDEFAYLTQKSSSGNNPLAQDLDTFINTFMRANTIWFTAAHQELYQIDEQLRNTLLSLGTYILGSTSSMQSARELADCLFFRDPWWVKYWRPIYLPVSRYASGRLADLPPPVEPEFMPLEEQTELFAQQIKKLGRFQFLFRPAVAEGHIGSAVLPLTIRHEDLDPETGEYRFPDPQLMARVRAVLAAQSGIPVKRLLQEQESRQPRQEHLPQARHTLNQSPAMPPPATPPSPTQRRYRVS